LTVDQILDLLAHPEQSVFDWKRDFVPPRDEDAKGEFVKDVLAVANATAFSHDTGYVLYGVDPGRPDEALLGISGSYDDASLQQLVASTTDPPVEFLYYEVAVDASRRLGVVEVPRSRRPFHVVKRDVGKLRDGQILIRDGSQTRGIRHDDLIRLYLHPGNGYAEQLIAAAGEAANLNAAEAQRMHAKLAMQKHLIRQMEVIAGLPPGSLG